MNKLNYYTADEIKKMLNLANSTLYCWIAKGIFPKQVKMGLRKAVWPKDAVDDWMRERNIQNKTEEDFHEPSFEVGFKAATNNFKQLLYANREMIGDIMFKFMLDLISPVQDE